MSRLSKFFKREPNFIIDPDEVFLDSKNLPRFDTHQFEGRFEKPISWSTFFILALLAFIIGIFLLYRIWGLQVTHGDLYRNISENNSLKHDILIAPRGIIYDRNDNILVSNQFEKNEYDFPKRIYADKPGFSHLLGFVKYPAKDSSGFYYEENYEAQDGMEKYLNEILAGKNGLKIIEKDAESKVISESLIEKSAAGENARLAIDARIQTKMYGEIAALAERVGFRAGVGIIIDVNNGEILAMISFPEFNSQIMTNGEQITIIKSYLENKKKPFLNRAISGLYTPGSVIKPFLAFAALEENIISPNKTITSTGKLIVPNPYFPDQPSIFYDWKAHGAVDMRHALAVSSNVYFYEIGGGFENQPGLGIEKMEKYLKMFGFGASTLTGITNEEVGIIPNPEWKKKTFNGEPWRLGDTYNTAIGQYGAQVTPIQVVRAIAAIANGGTLVEPNFLKQATTTAPKGKKIGGNPEHYQIVREGMRLSVTEGTSKGLDVPYVKIAGKTGTAQLGSTKQLVNSWTAGFFPYENPGYAYLVVMESGPQSNLTGATFVMRQVMDWIAIYTPEYLE